MCLLEVASDLLRLVGANPVTIEDPVIAQTARAENSFIFFFFFLMLSRVSLFIFGIDFCEPSERQIAASLVGGLARLSISGNSIHLPATLAS